MSALSALYGRIARLRRAWYQRQPCRRRRLPHPVISIGNLVVGGSGKTPVTLALARALGDIGERPAVLSRGYGRRRPADGVVVVTDGDRVLEPVQHSGDEPQLLARALRGVPVLVSADRGLAGQLAVKRFGSTVLLLDDGYQHLQLWRDVDLLIVSPGDLDERVVPAGALREPLDAARYADAVLVPADARMAQRVGSTLGVPQVFCLRTEYDAPRPLGADMAVPSLARRALAVAGIARPQRFFTAARRLGWDVQQEVAFPDHHWFTANDVGRILQVARARSVDAIVTTEKDAMRLEGIRSDIPWVVLPMHVTIEPAATFVEWVRDRLVTARQSRPASSGPPARAGVEAVAGRDA